MNKNKIALESTISLVREWCDSVRRDEIRNDFDRGYIAGVFAASKRYEQIITKALEATK
jgi:hypothetical protein